MAVCASLLFCQEAHLDQEFFESEVIDPASILFIIVKRIQLIFVFIADILGNLVELTVELLQNILVVNFAELLVCCSLVLLL